MWTRVGLGLICVATACGRLEFDTRADAALPCESRVFARPAASAFRDDFSAGALIDRWRPVSSCIDQVSGELVATPPVAPGEGSYCHAYTLERYHLTCDRVTVRVPEVTSPELGVQTFVYIASDDYIPTLHLLLEAGGFQLGEPDSSIAVTGEYSPTDDAWWRLGEADGDLVFDTSADGVSWVPRARFPVSVSLDDVSIALGAGTYKPVGSAGRARFRCFNVSPPCM